MKKTLVNRLDKIEEGFKNPHGMVITPSMRSAVAEHVRNHIKKLHKLKP